MGEASRPWGAIMRVLRTLSLFVTLLSVPAVASAVTVRDIIELAKAGLTDDVLIAVIDADRTVFTLDKDQILHLKQAGVGKAVLLKMLRTRREFEPPPETYVQPEAPAQPEVVVIGATPPPPSVTVVVPQYVAPQYVAPQYLYVPYSIWGVPTHRVPSTPPQPFMSPEYRGFGRFINDGWVERPGGRR